MSIDFKSPYVIGGGVLLGLILLANRPRAASISAGDISAASLASSVQQNVALGVPSIQAETDRQKTQAELAAIAVTSRAALAQQQAANQYAFAATALETTASFKALDKTKDTLITGTLADIVRQGAAASNEVVKNYQTNVAKAQLLQEQIQGEIAIQGMNTLLAKTVAGYQKAVEEKRIQAQVDIAKKQADSDLFGSIFGTIGKIFG